MEHDATWWLESPDGMGLAGSGLGATLRDYGRFGLLVQQDGASSTANKSFPRDGFSKRAVPIASAENQSTTVTYGGPFLRETRCIAERSRRSVSLASIST